MALIPDEVLAEIRSRVDIVAVIGQHVQLRKVGRNWKGLCPFHGEKTPSFSVNSDKGYFNCFGCQKKGDAFTFVMEIQGKTFHEAVEQLAAMAGVNIPIVEENPAAREARSERAKMFEINRLATAFFREQLGKHPAGQAYLDKRKIGAEASERFQLGYGPSEWHALADFLIASRADMEIAVKLGLVGRQPARGGFYDRFRDRLVCPIIVPGGEIVGFSARLVGDSPPGPDGQTSAKYINSPESSVYKKSKLLFGLYQAREALRTKGRAVLVEGNFDVVSMHQAGFTETIAPLGTALTAEQVEQMRRLADQIVVFYDGDRAGYQATINALSLAFAAEVPIRIATRPGRAGGGGAGTLRDGADPDTMVHAAGGPEVLAEMLDRARPGLEYLAYEVWVLAKTPEQKARAVDDAAKLLVKVASPTERDLIAGTLATAMQLDPGVVQRALTRARGSAAGSVAPRGSGAPTAPDISVSQKPLISEELDLLAILADHPNLSNMAENLGLVSLLTDERLRDMYSASQSTPGTTLAELAPARLPAPSAQHILAGRFITHPDPAHLLTSMITSIRNRQSTFAQSELLRRLADARRRGDTQLERELANEVLKTRKQVD